MKETSLIILILTLSSCAGLFPGRSYIDAMEDESIDFFVPHENFRVIPGDTGLSYRSRNEVIRRTPASDAYQKEVSYNQSLEEELRYLESIQNKHAMGQYNQVKNQLGGTSEKIYFLRIPSMAERTDYLKYKGLFQESNYYTSNEYSEASNQQELLIGMSQKDVERSFGRPIRRDVAGDPSLHNERWGYLIGGETKYIYFENGRVEGWSAERY